MFAGQDDKPPILKVIVGVMTRDPTAAELPLILGSITEYTRELGMPPLADHTVKGVGEVLFMRPPSPFRELSRTP
jgi:hypothetical protein